GDELGRPTETIAQRNEEIIQSGIVTRSGASRGRCASPCNAFVLPELGAKIAGENGMLSRDNLSLRQHGLQRVERIARQRVGGALFLGQEVVDTQRQLAYGRDGQREASVALRQLGSRLAAAPQFGELTIDRAGGIVSEGAD